MITMKGKFLSAVTKDKIRDKILAKNVLKNKRLRCFLTILQKLNLHSFMNGGKKEIRMM